MSYYQWNTEKNTQLKAERGINFAAGRAACRTGGFTGSIRSSESIALSRPASVGSPYSGL